MQTLPLQGLKPLSCRIRITGVMCLRPFGQVHGLSQAPRQSVRATPGRRNYRSRVIQRVSGLRRLAARSAGGLACRALNHLSWPAPHRPPPALSRPLPVSAAGSVRHSVSHGPCSSPAGRVAGPPTRHAPASRRQGPRLPGASLPPATGQGPRQRPPRPKPVSGEGLAMLAS